METPCAPPPSDTGRQGGRVRSGRSGRGGGVVRHLRRCIHCHYSEAYQHDPENPAESLLHCTLFSVLVAPLKSCEHFEGAPGVDDDLKGLNFND